MPVKSHPGALAIVPPAPPLLVPLAGVENAVYGAHEALAQLREVTSTLLNPNLITRTLDRREAVRSSQIEGSQSDVDQLLEYEATGSDAGLPPDVRTTLNYVKALDYGLAEVKRSGREAFSVELLQEIHRRLMAGDAHYRDTPGQVRSRQNWIGGGSIYQAKIVPPPPEALGKSLDEVVDLMRYATSEEDQYSVSIVVRMAVVHAQFELIHPFLDGNGRVGRILLPLMLAAEGYPPAYLAGYMKSNQSEYYRALGDAQLREKWPQWVQFMAHAVQESCRDAMDVTHDLLAMKESWRQRLAGLRSDASALAALDFVLSKPVLTVNNLKDHLGVSFPAANSAVEVLKTKGILAESTKEGRARVFVARDVIARLEKTPERHRAPAASPTPPAMPAPAPAVLLEQLKARVVLMTDRLIRWSDAPFKRASGTILAANARWAAIDLGDRVQILDREKWPVEEGCRYVLNAELAPPSVTRRPVETNTAVALQQSYGDKIGNLARDWVSRDRELGLVKRRDPGRGF
ncbi:Fic/DOC family N-terminal domain-containing protein [Azoarcus sp. DN11]|uniref:Fic family protein n=1 Tax=Azoarcus sp. DN11 TaxID=356837 RepID=UPI001C2BEDD4|nr:Fic/DOC family N-terminal domain-containing protein [Azoarcus sp. DN11]